MQRLWSSIGSNLAAAYQRWRLVHLPERVPVHDPNGVLCQWVSTDPPILRVAHWVDERCRTIFSLQPVFRALRARPAYFLYQWNWHLADDAKVALVARAEEAHRRRYPEHHIIHLCNSLQQYEAFVRHGIEAVFCNHNCFIDESVYRPLADVPKHFDAVHNARLKAYKRHFLAGDIESLAMLYAYSPTIDTAAEVDAIRRSLPQAHWFNHADDGSYRGLADDEVCRRLNECRVGLCLSAVEGAMYASMEYLLCGLPVVSTPSLGGRDVFFDDENSLIVEPTPAAVRAGVEQMLARNPAPEAVRAGALPRIQEHRRVFVETVQAIYDQHRVGRTFAVEFPTLFYNRLLRYQPHAEILAQLPSVGG